MTNNGEFQMPQMSDKDRRRVVRWGAIILAIIVLVVVIMGALAPYVDYLWFSLDARQPRVFTLGYETKSLLFAPAFFVSWALLHFSLKRAFKLSLIYIESPSSAGQVMLSNALHFVQERGWSVVRIAAPAIALLTAGEFANEWNTFLLASHAQHFGVNDPIFHFDLAFFVFSLPWYRSIVNAAFGLLLLTTILTVAVYAGLQLLAAMAKVELGRPNIRQHIGILAGLTILAFGAQLFLKTYEFGLVTNSQFVGAGYSAMVQYQVQRVVAFLIAVLGLTTIALARSARVYDLLIRGSIGLAVVSFLGIVAVPALIQQYSVEPDKLTKESPYAARAIQMTRYAYGLDKIAARDFPVQDVPTKKDLDESKATLDNMRLWDPEIVRQSIEFLQSFRSFYQFNDVDVDRYTLGGKATEVMLSPRDIYLAGLRGNSTGWLYQRLQYTHGYGLVMATVNTSTADGEPDMLIKDLPPVTPPELPLSQPRIYYSDFRGYGAPDGTNYALVGSNQAEYDYPAQDKEVTSHWEGSGGIPVGGTFRRLALSIVLGDTSLLVSKQVTPDTRLLMHRSILDRCSRMYPFLRLDNDPYIVLLNGKIYWIVDGYTSTDRIPYSDLSGDGDGSLNYIRNSVKIVIDAYSGQTTAYAIDPGEPILKAYRSIYPGLIRDPSEIPPGFREHFRYPEDMFTLQASELTLYHVVDPVAFLNNNDAWQMPAEKGLQGGQSMLQPYYVEMTLPGEHKDGFVLMLPFTPLRKPNMTGWLAANCDPDRYGQMVLYNFAKGENVDGPEQMETNFGSDPKVNAALLELKGGGAGDTDVVIGNMLVIPIGNSVLYAESLFPKSRTAGLQATPRLRKVVLGVNGRIEVGDTYRDALDRLFGTAAGAPGPAVDNPPPKPGNPAPSATPQTLVQVRSALDLLDKADGALRAGDFAKYGALQKEARAKLRGLVGQ